MAKLMDPLTDEQRDLVDIVWSVFAERELFPHFHHVAFRMRKKGHRDTAKVLYSFPAAGQDQVSNGYRAVGWWGRGTTPEPDGPVNLTMAGLYHLQHIKLARDLATGLLAYMQQLTREQEKILDNPFKQPNIEVDLNEFAKTIDGGWSILERMAAIADQEWPGMRFNKTSRMGQLGTLPEADYDVLDLYLADVSATLTPAAPPQTFPFTEPRALLRALNFLDVTHELVVGHPLVVKPPMDRSSLLALDVHDEAGYTNGLAVLTDLLRDLKVPGSKPPQGHLRLPNHLAATLSTIDQTAVERAVQLLDQIRIIRNSAVHPKPSADLQTAHQMLDLPWPVRDFTAAWDNVRAHAERAVQALQEAIQDTRS